MAKASVFAAANPDAALAILETVVPENFTDPQFAAVLMRYSIERTAPPAPGQEGAADPAAWDAKMQALLIPGGQSGLEAPVDLSALVSNDLVAEYNDFDAEAIQEQARTYE
jgi:hypothetical protein